MRKNIKNIAGSILFVAIAWVMFLMLTYALRPIEDGAGNRDAFSCFYAQQEDSLDIVALGSSSIYRFLNNPFLWEEYKMTSYNLATGSQPVGVYKWLLEEVQKTQTPDLVIVETRAYIKYTEDEELQDVRFRRVSDYMSYSWNRIKMINEYEQDWKKRWQLYFDIVFYHGQWEKFKFADFKYAENKLDAPMKGWGNVYKIQSVKPTGVFDDVKMQKIDEKREKDLIDFMEYCKSKEIEVLFVATPWMIDEESVSKNLHLEKLIEEYGFGFLDCNQYMDEIGLDLNADFYDKNHVNVWGAEKVTRFIGEYICNHYEMDSAHSAETTKEWDETAQIYRRKVEKAEAKD